MSSRIKRCLILSAFIIYQFLIIYTANSLAVCIGLIALTIILISIYNIYAEKHYNKEIQIKYEKQLSFLSALFENSPDLIYYKDKNYKYRACNKALCKLFDLDKEDKIDGKTDYDLYSQNIAKEIRKHDEKVIKTGEITTYLQTNHVPNKKDIIHQIIKAPLIMNGEIKGLIGIARDVTLQQNLQEIMLVRQAQMTAILDNLPFIAYLQDLEGRIIQGNKKIKEFIGIDEKDYIGKPVSMILWPDLQQEIRDENEFIIKEKKILVKERLLSSPNGDIYLEIHKAPICNENNDVIGIVVVCKNITSEKEKDAQKETFVATLTHDLKTPISSQARALDLLLNNTLGEINNEQKEILEQTRSSCKFVQNMIGNLLHTYKYENGKAKLYIKPFNITEIVEETCNELYLTAKDRGIKLLIKSPKIIEEIYADPVEIKRVIVNLISNAISYANADTDIEVTTQINNNELLFEVKNKSKYIPKEELTTLFEKYISKSHRYNRIGTGLGLYASKQIVSFHKGYMTATSVKDEGNTFGFIIPLSPDKSVNNNRTDIIENINQ